MSQFGQKRYAILVSAYMLNTYFYSSYYSTWIFSLGDFNLKKRFVVSESKKRPYVLISRVLKPKTVF